MRTTRWMKHSARVLLALGLVFFASAAEATKYTYNTPMVFPHPDIGQGAVIRTTDLIGVITRLRVTLHDVHIPEPAELEVYFAPLEHPGVNIHLFTRFPGNLVTADHATVTFDDFTARPISLFNGVLRSGTFQRLVAPNAFSDSLSAYIGSNPNLHWELFVYIRGQGSIGSWSLDIENAEPAGAPQTFTSASGLITNDNDFQPATPYPATLEVSGLDGMVVIGAGVTLTDFTSPRPEDHDMLVEAPDTRGAVFFSDLGANCVVAQTPEEKIFGQTHHECGEPLPVQNLTMMFAHTISGFPANYPFGPLQSDTYPARDIDLRIPGVGDEDEFRVPTARFNNAHDLRALNGAPANGQWSLFVKDDQARNFEQSTIGSWSVTIWPGTPEPLVMAPVSDIVRDAPTGQCSVPIVFDTPFVKGTPTPTLTINPASGSAFPVGVTPVQLTAFNYVGTAEAAFTVTVRDRERPMLAVTAPMVFNNDPNPLGTQVHYPLSVSDNCPGATVTANPPSGTYFAVGTHQVTAFATDASGNVSEAVQFNVTIEDHTPPVITYAAAPGFTSNWGRQDVVVTVSATDPGGLGVQEIACSDGLSLLFSDGPGPLMVTVSREGETTIRCDAHDGFNATPIVVLPVIRIDKTPPQIIANISPTPNAHGWNNTDVAVHFDVSDATSGILDADDHIDLLFTTEGTRNLTFFARDRAGNCAVIGNISSVCPVLSAPVVRIDKTAPQLTVSRTPANANGWNNTDVEFHASAIDVLSGLTGVSTVDRFYNHEGRGTWFGPTETFTFTDFAGNSVSASPGEVNIDKTPPVITNPEIQPPPNAAGWNRTPPVVRASVFEPLSGADVTSFHQVVTTEGQFNIPFTVTDMAGNSATHTFVVKTDFTAPTATATRFGSPNANGWDKSVSIAFQAQDSGSGVLSSFTSVNFDTEGRNLTATGPVPIDRAGNIGEAATLTGLNVDHTPPVVTRDRSPLANANGWNNTDVTVTFTATDALAGMQAPTVVQQTFTTEAAHQALHTFTDLAGNTAQAFENNILIDKTPPSVSSSVSPGPNAAGWNNTPVTLRFDGHDGNTAGINSGIAGSGVVELPFASEGMNLGASQTFTDRAGNSATGSRFGINIDRTPPMVTITKSPPANEHGWNTTDVLVQFAAVDGLSGISGAATAEALVTGEVKNHEVMQQFVDAAGNRRFTSALVSIDRTPPTLWCSANPPFITPGTGLVPITLDVFFDDQDEFSSQSRGPAYLHLKSIVSSAPQAGDIVDWTPGTDDRTGSLLAPATSSAIVYTFTYEGSDLAGHVGSCTMQVTVANPKTDVTSLSPNSAVAGAADVALVITGAGFIDGAVVKFDGTQVPSSLVSENEIHATVPAALLASSGGAAVTVENPAPYAGLPGTGVFLVTDAPVSIASMQTGQSTPENPFVFLQAGATPEGAPDTVFLQASGIGTIGLATYSANPGATFAGGSNFFDVFVAPGSTFDAVDIWTCALGGATEVFWFSDEGWRLASHQTYYPGDEFTPACIQITVNAEGTSPTIAELMGTYFAPGSDISAPELTLPPAVSVEAPDAQGAIVTYAVSATDDTDPNPVVFCTPASGTLFPIGQTVVTCTATDYKQNSATGTFTVTVTEAVASGRMSGGGFVEQGDSKHHAEFNVSRSGDSQAGRVAYWVTGPARSRRSPPSRFEATSIASVVFATGETSVVVKGEGVWNGASGYTFELRATDAAHDSMSIVVKDAAGAIAGSVSGSLAGGNIQSKSGGE